MTLEILSFPQRLLFKCNTRYIPFTVPMTDKDQKPKRDWILLIHHLPPKPTNLRVRIWRKLQKLGACSAPENQSGQSNTLKLIPGPLPFFNHHKGVWLMSISLACQKKDRPWFLVTDPLESQ